MKKIALLFAGLLMAGFVNAQNGKAIIRLDGLSVMYAGIDNPITVLAQDYQQKDLTLIITEGKGTIEPTKEAGQYNVRPTPETKTMTIAIDAKDKKGKRQCIAKQTFILREIPAPVLSLAGFPSGGRIHKNEISSNSVVVPMKDPSFLLKINPNSMKIVKMIVAVGPREVVLNGSKFNEEAVSIVKKAMIGDKMVIMAEVMMPDGKVQTGNAVYILKGPERKITAVPAVDTNGHPILDENGKQLYREVIEDPDDEDLEEEEEED